MKFGGYDQSRTLGDVGTFDMGVKVLVNLLDVQIGVDEGSSPFSESSYSSLLRFQRGAAGCYQLPAGR